MGTMIAGVSVSLIGVALVALPKVATINSTDPKYLSEVAKKMKRIGTIMTYSGLSVVIIGGTVGLFVGE